MRIGLPACDTVLRWALAAGAAADAEAGLAAAREARDKQAERVAAIDDQLAVLTGGLAVKAFGEAIAAERFVDVAYDDH